MLGPVEILILLLMLAAGVFLVTKLMKGGR